MSVSKLLFGTTGVKYIPWKRSAENSHADLLMHVMSLTAFLGDAVPIIVWVPSLPLVSPWSPATSLGLNLSTLSSPFFLASFPQYLTPVDHSLFAKPSHSFAFHLLFRLLLVSLIWGFLLFCPSIKYWVVLWVSLAAFSWHPTCFLGTISSVPMILVSLYWWLPSPNHQPRTLLKYDTYIHDCLPGLLLLLGISTQMKIRKESTGRL